MGTIECFSYRTSLHCKCLLWLRGLKTKPLYFSSFLFKMLVFLEMLILFFFLFQEMPQWEASSITKLHPIESGFLSYNCFFFIFISICWIHIIFIVTFFFFFFVYYVREENSWNSISVQSEKYRGKKNQLFLSCKGYFRLTNHFLDLVFCMCLSDGILC